MKRILLLAVAAFAATMPCFAELHLCPLFSDNMVLQQKSDAPVWGTAVVGATVRVTPSWDGLTRETVAGLDGKWRVVLQTPSAGGPYSLTLTETLPRKRKPATTLTFSNILMGEVWFCSGQSNMQMPVGGDNPKWGQVFNYEREVADADSYPDIRLLDVERKTALTPQDDFTATANGWQVCSSETIPSFSATAYFFGRTLYRELGVPIGLIHSSWGGTCIETWISPEALADIKSEKRGLEILAGQPQVIAEHPEQAGNPNVPTLLYNAMVHPFLNFRIKGAIWYQGETNAGASYQYRDTMPLLIADWRARWGYDFPFHLVQLSAWLERQSDPNATSGWAELREAQTMTHQTVPGVGMAVTIDIGDAEDIHPKNKQEVGRRLALQSLVHDYRRTMVCDGPTYAGFQIVGDEIRIRLRSAEGLHTTHGEPVKGFVIAGGDHTFHWAEARIDGKDIVVSCPDVRHPLAVRYAWAFNPEVNLVNGAGLPAAPFRTDDWPGETLGKPFFK